MIVFSIPSNKFTGLSLPDPWSWKRDHQPWLRGSLGSTNQGRLVLSDAIIFGHQSCSAVFSMLKGWEVFKRNLGEQKVLGEA